MTNKYLEKSFEWGLVSASRTGEMGPRQKVRKRVLGSENRDIYQCHIFLVGHCHVVCCLSLVVGNCTGETEFSQIEEFVLEASELTGCDVWLPATASSRAVLTRMKTAPL